MRAVDGTAPSGRSRGDGCLFGAVEEPRTLPFRSCEEDTASNGRSQGHGHSGAEVKANNGLSWADGIEPGARLTGRQKTRLLPAERAGNRCYLLSFSLEWSEKAKESRVLGEEPHEARANAVEAVPRLSSVGGDRFQSASQSLSGAEDSVRALPPRVNELGSGRPCCERGSGSSSADCDESASSPRNSNFKNANFLIPAHTFQQTFWQLPHRHQDILSFPIIPFDALWLPLPIF